MLILNQGTELWDNTLEIQVFKKNTQETGSERHTSFFFKIQHISLTKHHPVSAQGGGRKTRNSV